MAISNPHKDINDFGNLRKQLAPLISRDTYQLLQRIEAMLGAGSLPVPPHRQKKRVTHASRVAKYLIPNN